MLDDREHRTARMRQELQDVGLDVPAGVVGEILLDELVSARYVPVHEGIRPTYGALIASAAPDNAVLKTPTAEVSADDIRALADGSSTFVFRDVNEPAAFGILSLDLLDETDVVAVSSNKQATVVQRHDEGTITVVFPEEIWVNELFTWRRRPIARQLAIDIKRVLNLPPGQTFKLIMSLLEFAFHELSPRGIGTTLVIPVQPGHQPSVSGFSGVGTVPPFELSALEASDRRMLKTFLRVVDGACVLTPDGIVERTKVKLDAGKDTHKLIPPEGGTRHSSAKWFSFEHPEYVIIVVSADGPVSLWSDGRRLAELSGRATPARLDPVRVIPSERRALVREVRQHTCDRCAMTMDVQLGGVDDPEIPRTIFCVVCGAHAVTVTASEYEIRVMKPWELTQGAVAIDEMRA